MECLLLGFNCLEIVKILLLLPEQRISSYPAVWHGVTHPEIQCFFATPQGGRAHNTFGVAGHESTEE